MLDSPATSVDEQSDKPTSVAETLRRARALIEDPKHWTKGAYARARKGGRAVEVDDPDASAFCMIGAIKCVAGPCKVEALELLASVVPNYDLSNFNDSSHRTHAQVLGKFDEAIAKAEAEAV